MSNRVFIAKGNGYAGDPSFEGFTVVAAPLPGYDNAGRESRVFYRQTAGRESGTDYGSHIMRLAVETRARLDTFTGGRQLYILVQHGGGTEVLMVPSFYDGGEYERALLSMPERLQYAAIYSLYKMARAAHDTATEDTAHKYSLAFIEKRLKTKRRNNRKYVEIVPPVSAPKAADKTA